MTEGIHTIYILHASIAYLAICVLNELGYTLTVHQWKPEARSFRLMYDTSPIFQKSDELEQPGVSHHAGGDSTQFQYWYLYMYTLGTHIMGTSRESTKPS